MQAWISSGEFCAKYGCTKDNLYWWRKKGWITSSKRGGKFWFYLDPGWFENPLIVEHDLMPLMRGNEIAQVIGIDPRSIRSLVESKRLTYTKVGNVRRYTINDIRKMLGYRFAKKLRKNGVPVVTPEHVRKAVIEWALKRLAEIS